MASFDELREKAMTTAGMVADKSVGFAKGAADKAKLAGRITRLRTEVAMEKDSMRKTFTEIGKLYYEKYKDNPEPEMAQAVADISTSMEMVEMKRQEADELKKRLYDDFGEVVEDVEELADDAVDDIIEKAETVAKDMAGKAETAAQDVADKVEEAVEDIAGNTED